VVQQGAEADRREVNPTIQVETATLPRLSGPASPGPTGLGLVDKEQCFSEDECEDEEREENALGAVHRDPDPGAVIPRTGRYEVGYTDEPELKRWLAEAGG
jgi:hypothetical protein